MPASRSLEVTSQKPRLSLLHILRRVQMRMIDMQVWDVAGTMTFYLLLSIFPAGVAVVSMVSLLGVEKRTLDALAGLAVEIFPAVDPSPYISAILAVAQSGGGVLGLTLGIAGAIISASNGVAAFHRALHRVYDTREGRAFLRFRLVVLGETLILMVLVILTALLLILGSEASQQVGEVIGVPTLAFDVWNYGKWPLLLVVLAVGVSLIYYRFPNVRLPRYRLVTAGSVFTVTVLFLAAVLLGRLAGYATRVADVLPTLNGLIAILVLLWLANIVIIAGAAIDAEVLRARQIAQGLPAWGSIVLEPHARTSLHALENDAQQAAEVSRVVYRGARRGEAVTHPRSRYIVEAASPFAVNPTHRERSAQMRALMTSEIPLIDPDTLEEADIPSAPGSHAAGVREIAEMNRRDQEDRGR